MERGGGQVRGGGMGGVIGLDLPALLTLAEDFGFDRADMAHLLPYGEAGMVSGLARVAKDRRGEADAVE